MMLYYDRYALKLVPIPEDLKEYYCFRCKGKRPVQKWTWDIVCDECKSVLLTR